MTETVIIRVPRRRFGYRKQGFYFVLETWFWMSNYTQLALNELDELKDYEVEEDGIKKQVNRFLPVAMLSAARMYDIFHKKRKPRFDETDVMRWISKISVEDLGRVYECMLKTRIGGETLDILIEENANV